ncbi:hypothetical protein HID58_093144 [Brassica napus]|uniref:Uncharacterized protein n=1 Tax=Brassica napus TaxID=3708 RepID=A0ABQ7XC63_BRANA|nr:hypothetical protein HID58_093144 [Brassica napus]
MAKMSGYRRPDPRGHVVGCQKLKDIEWSQGKIHMLSSSIAHHRTEPPQMVERTQCFKRIFCSLCLKALGDLKECYVRIQLQKVLSQGYKDCT